MILSSFMILIFTKEKSAICCPSRNVADIATEELEDYERFEYEKIDLLDTYKIIIKILKLVPIRKLTFILLTSKIAFMANSVTFLKFVEAGVTKETQTIMAIPLTFLGIFYALFARKYISGSKSLIYYLRMIFIK